MQRNKTYNNGKWILLEQKQSKVHDLIINEMHVCYYQSNYK
jgi:hypothetical protein